jgi:hypothetical protein
MSNAWRFDLDKVVRILRPKIQNDTYDISNIQYAAVMRNIRFTIWDGSRNSPIRLHLSANGLEEFKSEEEIAEHLFNLYALEQL